MAQAMVNTAKFKPQYNLTSERYDVLFGNLKPLFNDIKAITKLVGLSWSLK